MTLQECYTQLGGNYDDAKHRLMADKIVQKFLIRFIDDPSMDALLSAVEENDREKSFVAVHTLKGVAANLALTALQKSASALTEQLRSRQNDPDIKLLQELKEVYAQNINTIKEYQQSLE